MSTSAALSLAVLKVNWEQGKDFLDNFVLLVAECIRVSQFDVISVPELKNELRNRFGLEFPHSAIKAILGRVARHGYIRRDRSVYVPERAQLALLDFHAKQQEVLRAHEALIEELISFCRDKFEIHWSSEDAETGLQSFLEEDQLNMVSALTSGTLIPPVQNLPTSTKYLVGAFVQHLQEQHAAGFDYMETVVKGNMLANAIFLPEREWQATKFRHTSVYLDTSFLIYALGYGGSVRKEPCTELLDLLRDAGAELRSFRHTLMEVRNALQACAYRIGSDRTANGYGPSVEYFLSMGSTASDIELYCARLENDLAALQIQVVDKPTYIREYVIDEKALAQLLDERLTYSHVWARDRDVDSISAIVRLRECDEFYTVEDCRAIFVTTNAALARAAREFAHREASPNAVPPCITDYALTNLLWIKKPTQKPNLPRHRIIADCYAAMQPEPRLWAKYLAEIGKLQELSQCTEEEYYLLRYSLEGKQTLMDLTLGEQEAFTQGTPQEILQLVKANITRTLEEQIRAQESDLVKALENKTKLAQRLLDVQEATTKREEERVARVHARANTYARRITRILGATLFLLLVMIAASTFPWTFPALNKAPLKYAVTLLQLIMYALTILDLWKGVAIRDAVAKAESYASRIIESKLRTLSES